MHTSCLWLNIIFIFSCFLLGKCFMKLNYNIDEDRVKGAVSCKAGVIELILQDIRHYVG